MSFNPGTDARLLTADGVRVGPPLLPRPLCRESPHPQLLRRGSVLRCDGFAFSRISRKRERIPCWDPLLPSAGAYWRFVRGVCPFLTTQECSSHGCTTVFCVLFFCPSPIALPLEAHKGPGGCAALSAYGVAGSKNSATLVGVRWSLAVLLSCLSLVISGAEYLFMAYLPFFCLLRVSLCVFRYTVCYTHRIIIVPKFLCQQCCPHTPVGSRCQGTE